MPSGGEARMTGIEAIMPATAGIGGASGRLEQAFALLSQ